MCGSYINNLAMQTVEMLEKEWDVKVFQRTPEHYGHMPIMPLPKGAGSHITHGDATQVMAFLMAQVGGPPHPTASLYSYGRPSNRLIV